jgi:hypothetical protein
MKLTKLTSLLPLLALAFTLSVSGGAHCQGQDVLYSDDFKTADPAWGTDAKIGGGKFSLTSDVNNGFDALNQANLFQDMTMTVTATIVSGDDDSDADLLFWAKDYSSYYAVCCEANGKLAILRFTTNRWLYPVQWRDCPELKKGIGQANVVKIVVRGNQATININGKDIVTFKGQIPDGGGEIGFRAGGATKAKTTVEFSKFQVTK